MLPLDEEPFEIDANKRTITVPIHFKSSGVSVVGDEIAETVFFRIARFFDAMDLETCDIFVQWSDIDGNEFATPINLIDIESDPGYIIFAWPISSAMTKQAGNIKFNVRFLKQDDASGLIVYSFSTLTTEVKINNGLNFDISRTTEDDVSALFAAAIQNSQSAVGIPAAFPIFHINLADSDNNPLTSELAYLIPQADGSRSLTLTVYADTTDTGIVRYEWYKKVGDSIGSKVLNPNITDILVPTADAVPANDKTYYTSEGALYDVTEGFDPEVVAYEKHQQLTLSGSVIVDDDSEDSVIGQYYVKAINRFGNKEAETISNIITLPGPTTPVITTDLVTGVIEKDEEDKDVPYTLSIACTTADQSHTTYTWSKSATEDGDFTVISGETNSSYDVEEAGFYKVKITSEINLSAKEKESEVVRVTKLPAPVVFDDGFKAEDTAILLRINAEEDTVDLREHVTTPVLDNPLSSDKVEYHWYIDTNSGDGVLDANGNVYEAAVDITYDPTVPYITGLGTLADNLAIRCVATNSLNGKIKNTQSVLYVIVAE